MSVHSRRRFLCGLACGCAAAATPRAAEPVFAASAKPKTNITADQALDMTAETRLTGWPPLDRDAGVLASCEALRTGAKSGG